MMQTIGGLHQQPAQNDTCQEADKKITINSKETNQHTEEKDNSQKRNGAADVKVENSENDACSTSKEAQIYEKYRKISTEVENKNTTNDTKMQETRKVQNVFLSKEKKKINVKDIPGSNKDFDSEDNQKGKMYEETTEMRENVERTCTNNSDQEQERLRDSLLYYGNNENSLDTKTSSLKKLDFKIEIETDTDETYMEDTPVLHKKSIGLLQNDNASDRRENVEFSVKHSRSAEYLNHDEILDNNENSNAQQDEISKNVDSDESLESKHIENVQSNENVQNSQKYKEEMEEDTDDDKQSINELTELPKLNGDSHIFLRSKSNSELDVESDVLSACRQEEEEEDDEIDKRESVLESNSYDYAPKAEEPKTEKTVNIIKNDDDDLSQSSTSSSASSDVSSTSSSASSRNLVIDHPFEEFEAPITKAVSYDSTESNKAQNGEMLETKKRRHSEEFESESPKHKHPHLDLKPSNAQTEQEEETCSNKSGTEEVFEKHFSSSQLEKETLLLSQEPSLLFSQSTAPEPVMPLVQNDQPDVGPKESLTTIRPFSKSPPAHQQMQEIHDVNPFNEYISNSSEIRLIEPQQMKYHCFQCKLVSFDSFADLRNHQHSCLLTNKPTVGASVSKPLTPTLYHQNVASLPPPRQLLSNTVTLTQETTQQKKRYYMCSACGTYHENWNLFLHIREIHNRHVCLYCIRLFPTAEKLSLHLEIKHDLEQNHFNSEDTLRGSSVGDSRFLMCCTCQHVFSEHERFSDHICTEYMQPCTLCGQKGRHTNQCKANPEKRSKVKKKPKPQQHELTSTSTSFADTAVSSVKINNTTVPVPVTHSLAANQQSLLQAQQPVPAGTSSLCDNRLNFNTKEMTTLSSQEYFKMNGGYETSAEKEYSRLSSILGVSNYHQPLSPVGPAQVPISQPNFHSDDSNSSSNMVIDETCNSNNYGNSDIASAIVNPFRELDERERLEQQGCDVERVVEGAKPVLPPDRMIVPEAEAIPQAQPLIVPKFKLRVPKEFQKSVESEVSSTESEEEYEEEENEDIEEENGNGTDEKQTMQAHMHPSPSDPLQNGNADIESATEAHNDIEEQTSVLATKLLQPPQSQDEDSVDEPNSNLVRILAEIERTKMDIKRTRETLHSSVPPGEPSDQGKQMVMPNQTTSHRSWSPTPPASPDSAWGSPLREEGPTDTSPTQQQDQQHSLQQPVCTEQMETSVDLAGTEIDVMDTTIADMPNSIENNPATHTIEEIPPSSQKTQEQPVSLPGAESEEDENIDVCKRPPSPPSDGIEVADDDVQLVDLLLDRPIEKFEMVELVRICLKTVFHLCLYCNHARRIAVNGASLVLHLIAQHRFSATVDSITAEELLPKTIVSKLKSFLPALSDHFLNSNSYCTLGEGAFVHSFNERIFECFQCRFVTSTHKELYLHNRKMHLKTAILCFMCRESFYSFSEILCHVCPGAPNKTPNFDVKFRCCLCDVDGIPSAFRLMVHLRKKHFVCDVCLEDCRDQARLSSHVWKHKLHHFCYRCNISYRNKMDITKHLFWKHGTESIICKQCLQKRWRHVYHFCVPPPTFVCDVCSLCFSKATYLKVHKRIHTGDMRYPCTEDNCEQKFVSRRLLLKHSLMHNPPPPKTPPPPTPPLPPPASTDVAEEAGRHPPQIKDEEKPKLGVESNVGKSEEVNAIMKEEKADAAGGDIAGKKEDDSAPTADKLDTPRKKKKRHRNKESLEDLNLIAPNLSESDSSDDSETTEAKSKCGDPDSLVPNVMLSPLSEPEADGEKESSSTCETGKIINIWKNFKTFQASQQEVSCQNSDDENDLEYHQPTPIIHVAMSDHDYCAMFKARPRPATDEATNAASTIGLCVDREQSPLHEKSVSPMKRNKKSPRGKKSGGSGSSSSDSSSGSDSSCSCGSNCSCTSSGSSGSSSSSSDDENSDSSTSEGRRRIAKKKAEKAAERRQRKKSECSLKTNSLSEPINVEDDDKNQPVVFEGGSPTLKKDEPLFQESDLDTAESETDEEFYDEHPKKLASELLAQKRQQLMAQTRLSPSHNFEIAENSRPSTPSLPEEVAKQKKVKLKKKKRERKSTCKSNSVKLNVSVDQLQPPAPITQHPPPMIHQTALQVPEVDLIPPYDLIASPGVAEPPIAQQPTMTTTVPSAHISTPYIINMHHPTHPIGQKQMPQTFTPRPVQCRVSEGSSCSDADGSLKRSKRARRPNKFYGYTSDDEHMGNPLMIGMRAFKPQPPPQLTWHKDDLPTPSKSILLNKNKTPRALKNSKDGSSIAGGDGDVGEGGEGGSSGSSSTVKKRRVHTNKDPASTPSGKPRKRQANKAERKLPPIPTLKIRPSAIGIIPAPIGGSTNHIPASQIYSSSKESDASSETSSDDENALHMSLPTESFRNTVVSQAATSVAAPAVIQQPKPLITLAPIMIQPAATHAPPVATAFNQKIPPALLPNPDIATLQYFKRNNIRYPIRPPAGARKPREGESVYCYCRCPYDEVSEMIACDGENCLIEWFHFECVGIMVAPQGKWFCAECRPKYSNELYPTV